MIFYLKKILLILILIFFNFKAYAFKIENIYPNLDSYQIISRSFNGNKWKFEKSWKIIVNDRTNLVYHKHEKILFEKYENNEKSDYGVVLDFYEFRSGDPEKGEVDQETKLKRFYTVEGRSSHYDVEFIDLKTYSMVFCGKKSAIIVLRSRLKEPYMPKTEYDDETADSLRRYKYDHIFLNLEQDGQAVFYEDPLDLELIDGPLYYYDHWEEKTQYNCRSGYISFE